MGHGQQFQPGQGVSGFDEDAKIQFGGFDYLILKQVLKVNEYSNLCMYSEHKLAFANSVITLHQIAKYYWLFDEEYQQAYKALLEMKKDVFTGVQQGEQTAHVIKPILMTKVHTIAEKDGKRKFGLFIEEETGETVEMQLEDVEVLFARLHYDLLMTIVSKRTKTIDQQDKWEDMPDVRR